MIILKWKIITIINHHIYYFMLHPLLLLLFPKNTSFDIIDS